jgi:hypothetical protein
MATTASTPSKTVIDTGEVFRLRNDSETETLKLSLGRRTWTIEPGSTALVPFEVIRVHWGDPRSRTGVYGKFSDSLEKGWINKREDEIKRLGVMYGSYANDVATLLEPEWPTHDVHYGTPKVVPHPVSVQTERGQPVILPAFDTGGEAVHAGIRNESENLNDEVQYREHLERQLDEIREELAKVSGRSAPDDTEVDIPLR